ISSPRRSSIALYFNVSGTPRTLLSFPTRRSSDLLWQWRHVTQSPSLTEMTKPIVASKFHQNQSLPAAHRSADRSLHNAPYFCCRSEEHTSELQSRENLVCRLLLEKKNKD